MTPAQARGAVPRVMTIAGSDSGGGAGIQADLKTLAAMGVYGTSAITAITAQNTLGVTAVQDVSLEVIGAQIDAIVTDIGTDSVKMGMLSSADIVELVASKIAEHRLPNVVLDTVIVAASGARLLNQDAVDSLRSTLLPLAMVATPNLGETEVLTGIQVQTLDDMKRAAAQIKDMGPSSVLVKGGHFEDNAPGQMADVLYDGSEFRLFTDDHIDTTNNHGTGCTLSSAIAAGLAQGLDIVEAVARAKAYLTGALRAAFPVGAGHGPLNHFHAWWSQGGADGRGGATHLAAHHII